MVACGMRPRRNEDIIGLSLTVNSRITSTIAIHFCFFPSSGALDGALMMEVFHEEQVAGWRVADLGVSASHSELLVMSGAGLLKESFPALSVVPPAPVSGFGFDFPIPIPPLPNPFIPNPFANNPPSSCTACQIVFSTEVSVGFGVGCFFIVAASGLATGGFGAILAGEVCAALINIPLEVYDSADAACTAAGYC